tara:strand:- start:47 stop:364 length:318 start_codon:yes stop_codon:yes gene_type:complete
MPNITMTFPHVNDSVQVNDIVYYQKTNGTIVKMGECTAVTDTTVSCNIGGLVIRPTSSDFILFSKNNLGNTSALRGYYAEVVMSNDEETQCELYTVGSEVFESSK